VGDDRNDFKDVDLPGRRASGFGSRGEETLGKLTPPLMVKSSARATAVPTAMKSRRPERVLLDSRLTDLSDVTNSFWRNS
jgi:hypothetical protein